MSAAESFAATGQEMFVDGSWGPSRSGETYEAMSPATGEVIGTVAQGDREDARAAIEAAGRAAEAWAGPDRLRPRGAHARGRRRHRGAPRRARAHAHARPGQAAGRGGLRRGRGARRLLAHGGRGRQAPGRRAAQLVLARQAGHARAPADRRRRGHQPVELALHHARRADRAGAGLRQHRGVDARALDRGVRGRPGPLHRRGRRAARRVQPRDRPGAGGRQRDRRQPRRPRRGLHRLDRRPAGSWPRRPRARSRCWRWAATARWSSWTTPTSTRRSRRRSPPATCAPGRAAPPASGSSSIAPCATSTSRSSRAA